MNVLRLYGPGDLRLSDEPCPAPQLNEELLRVSAVSLFGSDLLWLLKTRGSKPLPLYPFCRFW